MTSGIYGYWDNFNDKIVYVGQAFNIKTRHYEHLSPARYNAQTINRVLQNNKERYDLIVLKECSIEDLNHWEITLISLFNPKFNYTDGGEGSRGFKHSEETKQKLSQMLSGVNSSNYGKKFTESHRRKIGESKKGNTNFLGKKHTEETKQKIRNAHIGKKASKEAKNNMSKAQSVRNSKTGFYHVYKKKNPKYKNGFLWGYTYIADDGKRKSLFSASLFKLKEKVETKDLPWQVVNKELAKKTIEADESLKIKNDGKNFHLTKATTTGIFRVSKTKCPSCKQGFIWNYQWDENGKRHAIRSVSFFKLKNLVEAKGLPWIIVDKELAKKTINKNKKIVQL